MVLFAGHLPKFSCNINGAICRGYWRCMLLLVFCVLLLCCVHMPTANEVLAYAGPEHALNHELFSALKECDSNLTACADNVDKITLLCAKIANEHTALLLHDRALDIFDDILYFMQSDHLIGKRAAHILSVLSFAQGRAVQAEQFWPTFSSTDLSAQRTIAAQAVLTEAGISAGYDQLAHYLKLLRERFGATITGLNGTKYLMNASSPDYVHWQSYRVELERASDITDDVRDATVALLLSEAQGTVRPLGIRASDLVVAATEMPVAMDAKMRFQLGVGLAKLGLFELSMKHVQLAATPWDDPLYALRAVLVMAPVHTSVRALAAAVEEFETQAEAVLQDEALPRSYHMQQACGSPEEVALVLQTLPLLHLAGFSAPYHHLGSAQRGSGSNAEGEASLMFAALGYSSISLSALLSEVYQHVCPAPPRPSAALQEARDRAVTAPQAYTTVGTGSEKKPSAVIKVGVVSGSFDNIPGRIMIGILESMTSKSRKGVKFVAVCFATPRDATTDRVNALFDDHINLSAHNKTLILQRISDAGFDVLLFADAALDSRVFALAHERLALYQGVIWHWGGTLGIPTVDFYLAPELLWRHSKCAVLHRGPVPPQALFTEQVVLLEGLPYMASTAQAIPREEIRALLQTRYLLPVNNQTHIYVFPGSVKQLHPEFDRVIDVILKTDPLALVVLAVARSGRDNVPPTHIAVRHDLMHPSQPAAAVAKCLRRLRGRVGPVHIDRVRVLPPLDEAILRGLQQAAVAVLDPFPVGSHLQVLQAMLDQVPVLTAYALQECTNSHAHSFARQLNISFASPRRIVRSPKGGGNGASLISNTDNFELGVDGDGDGPIPDGIHALTPTTAEEYGVWAVRLQREPPFRDSFVLRDRRVIAEAVKDSRAGPHTHGEQLLQFLRTLVVAG